MSADLSSSMAPLAAATAVAAVIYIGVEIERRIAE